MNEGVVSITLLLFFPWPLDLEAATQVLDTSTLSSYSAKLDDFFSGIFLPAAVAFEYVREQIRLDQEKTWQGSSSPDNTHDETWPKPYAVLA
jgi:hypothetical protein